jgi:hypothetical protein
MKYKSGSVVLGSVAVALFILLWIIIIAYFLFLATIIIYFLNLGVLAKALYVVGRWIQAGNK